MVAFLRRIEMSVPRVGKEKPKYKHCFSLLRLVSMAACVVVFVYLMMDIHDKFAVKLTNIGIRAWPHDQATKPMPCITACPWEAFKKRGLFYNKKLLDENTFEKEEIFVHSNDYPIFDRQLFSIEEIRSIHFGRCYMVCPLKPYKINSDCSFMFKYGRSIKVFFHLREDSVWIPMGIPAIKMTILHLDNLQRPEIGSYMATVTEKRYLQLNKAHSPCKDYPDGNQGFTQCSRNFFLELLKTKINCTIPGLTEFLNTSTLPECQEATSGSHTFQEFFVKTYYKNTEEWHQWCPLSCNQTVFDVSLQRYHENNLPEPVDDSNSSGVIFSLKYESFNVEEHVETLIYDATNFLAQAGGNIGLLLGLSCLSFLFGFINFFEKLVELKTVVT